MNTELDFIKRVKLGLPLPGTEVLNRRTKGLSLIRQHFLSRLKGVTGVGAESSLIIRWRRLGEHANSRTIVDTSFELALNVGGQPVTGLFQDLWIVCYPDDSDTRPQVEAEMERMCQKTTGRSGT